MLTRIYHYQTLIVALLGLLGLGVCDSVIQLLCTKLTTWGSHQVQKQTDARWRLRMRLYRHVVGCRGGDVDYTAVYRVLACRRQLATSERAINLSLH